MSDTMSENNGKLQCCYTSVPTTAFSVYLKTHLTEKCIYDTATEGVDLTEKQSKVDRADVHEF